MDLGSHHGGHCPFLALESWGRGGALPCFGDCFLDNTEGKKKGGKEFVKGIWEERKWPWKQVFYSNLE